MSTAVRHRSVSWILSVIGQTCDCKRGLVCSMIWVCLSSAIKTCPLMEKKKRQSDLTAPCELFRVQLSFYHDSIKVQILVFFFSDSSSNWSSTRRKFFLCTNYYSLSNATVMIPAMMSSVQVMNVNQTCGRLYLFGLVKLRRWCKITSVVEWRRPEQWQWWVCEELSQGPTMVPFALSVSHEYVCCSVDVSDSSPLNGLCNLFLKDWGGVFDFYFF